MSSSTMDGNPRVSFRSPVGSDDDGSDAVRPKLPHVYLGRTTEVAANPSTLSCFIKNPYRDTIFKPHSAVTYFLTSYETALFSVVCLFHLSKHMLSSYFLS